MAAHGQHAPPGRASTGTEATVLCWAWAGPKKGLPGGLLGWWLYTLGPFCGLTIRRDFLFIFYFFLQKYIFIFEINRIIPRPPRAAGTWSPRCGAAGVFLQKFSRRICAKTPRRPVARQRGGRLPLHYLRVGCLPTPHLHH